MIHVIKTIGPLYWSILTIVLCGATASMAQHKPENLGSTVNSSYSEINPVLSLDGSTLYFVRVNHPENNYGEVDSEDIWYSELQPDGAWSEAQRIPELNLGKYNAVLGIMEDGSLMINGVYNKKGTAWKRRGLSLVPVNGDEFGKPKELRVPGLRQQNSGLKSSGTISKDGNFLVLSYSVLYNSKKSSLYVVKKDKKGKWKHPKLLHDLNLVSGSEDAPFLSEDNTTLYYSSNNGKDQYDIYQVTRVEDDDWDTWKDQKKVDEINTNGWEAYYHISPDGRWAYYSSDDNSMGGADIFRIRLSKEDTYATISGRILHAKNKRPMYGKTFMVNVDGKQADSVEIDADSARYELVIKTGKDYELAADMEYFKGLISNAKLNAIYDPVEINQDLLVDPLPYVLVKGKVINETSGQPILGSAHPVLYIDDQPIDSVAIDSLTGQYSMKVPYGKSYSMRVQADDYESTAKSLDLTNVDEYKSMNFDLGGRKPVSVAPVIATPTNKYAYPVVKLTGTIIDQRTGDPLSAAIPVQVKAEESAINATVDAETRDYEVELEAGKTYTLSASASKYFAEYETIVVKGDVSSIKRHLIVVPIEVGSLVRLNNIFFETGKAALKKESFPELDRVVSFLNDNPGITIEIRGHTDNVGNADMNQRLSEARAKSVKDYIVSKGISSDQLSSKGYGLTLPVATNSTEEGRAQNRRVEFGIVASR